MRGLSVMVDLSGADPAVPATPALPAETAEAQFERVVRTWEGALFRLACAYAHDAAERDDLMQDILFAIWRALRTFRGDCAERTFVFRVAHNRALTHIRARRRDVPIELAVAIADPRPDPASQAVSNQQRSRLMDAVRSLPDVQRQVIVLHLEGLTHAEIADVLGVTRNNVAVRLNRARDALRGILGENRE